MPFGDGTGPLGLGPMTGRAAGYCAGFGVPGYMNPVPGRGWGRGFGWGRGCGRGWRHWFWATGLPGWMRWGWWFGSPTAPTATPEAEKQWLKNQAEFLQARLDEIRKRLDEIESEKNV